MTAISNFNSSANFSSTDFSFTDQDIDFGTSQTESVNSKNFNASAGSNIDIAEETAVNSFQATDLDTNFAQANDLSSNNQPLNFNFGDTPSTLVADSSLAFLDPTEGSGGGGINWFQAIETAVKTGGSILKGAADLAVYTGGAILDPIFPQPLVSQEQELQGIQDAQLQGISQTQATGKHIPTATGIGSEAANNIVEFRREDQTGSNLPKVFSEYKDGNKCTLTISGFAGDHVADGQEARVLPHLLQILPTLQLKRLV